ncbi:MAG: hypothetical protein KF687_06930 [Cyclobacteriaceae bacterium]|nr:hypothetical protein [Cyclobacteriaceae bacterium]
MVLLAFLQIKMEGSTLSTAPDSIYFHQGNQLVVLTFDTLRNSLAHDQATGYAEGDLRGIWHVIFRLNTIDKNFSAA